MGYFVPSARSVLFFIYFGDAGELKASLGFTDIFFVVVLGWFFPHSGRANWGHSSVFPSCEARGSAPLFIAWGVSAGIEISFLQV